MMSIKSRTSVKYSCRKMPTPEEHELIRERVNNPYELTGRMDCAHSMNCVD